jgi:hypothetical protein
MGSQKRTILCHWGWVVTEKVEETPEEEKFLAFVVPHDDKEDS